MPQTFCRHNRFVENCSICSRKPRAEAGTVTERASGGRRNDPATPRPATQAGKRRSPRASDLVVRRVTRVADDGYDSDLVPGIRGSQDAVRLAAELGWAAARLDELRTEPPGLYAEAAGAATREEGIWKAFTIAVLSPLEATDDPWSSIRSAQTDWSSGEVPSMEGLATGPRAAAGGASLFAAYRAWAAKAGGQETALAGDVDWTPARRFDRAFDRLALPGFGRVPRYEFVTLVGALGLIEAQAVSLLLNDPAAEVTAAAKRVFGIGDPILIARRAGELAAAGGVPLSAFDLALQNWARPEGERITAGSRLPADAGSERGASVAAALGV